MNNSEIGNNRFKKKGKKKTVKIKREIADTKGYLLGYNSIKESLLGGGINYIFTILKIGLLTAGVSTFDHEASEKNLFFMLAAIFHPLQNLFICCEYTTGI